MEVGAAVTGCYVGWLVLALFPRKVVRLSWRIGQDILVLGVLSFLLPLICCELVSGLALAGLAYVMYNDLPAPWIAVNEKAVMVTGCDTGIGHALALRLDQLGFQVFAACLAMGGQGETSLVKSASSRLVTFQMDVTDDKQVEKGAKLVAEKLGGKVLHGVVNNAGILMAGNMEVMTWSDIQRIMDVNCFGVIRVYRAFMPLLRKPRRGMARLVNVASNIGIAPSAQLGAYGASKAANAILSETWRYELKPLGVSVSTIIPSGYKTGILLYDKETVGNRWWEQASQEVRDYFGRPCFVPASRTANYRDYLQPDFSGIVDCMTDALLSTHPKPFYYKGLMARSLAFLYLHLPPCLWDVVMPRFSDYYTFPVRALEAGPAQQWSKTD